MARDNTFFLYVEVPYTMDFTAKKVEFIIPPDDLNVGETYTLMLVNKPKSSTNNSSSSGLQSINNEEEVPPVIYQSFFRVSVYDRFADKVDYVSQSGIAGGVTMLEPFDDYEVYGLDNGENLVDVTVNLNVDYWFSQYRNKFKLVYNVTNDMPSADEDGCYRWTLAQFQNPPNLFDQRNFYYQPVGIENPLDTIKMVVSKTGTSPDCPTNRVQHFRNTAIIELSGMWYYTSAQIDSYWRKKCSGVNFYASGGGGSNSCANIIFCSPCNNNDPQIEQQLIDACINDSDCVYIYRNSFPYPPTGTRFPHTFRYRPPGLNTPTTIKAVEYSVP